ncbi:hypothetical protein [Streptomyces alanosinicus]|uniref:Uncharacterized protein n=1 Tax=Streptomyces alanosinicus TaxID=68171 RepID=A0A919D7H2_9ACTN|nr:hypothetical protein [Streptomyces alanosinicus]GHE14270.1 hypothetical protein GCM10010339_84270 [Streptomyces alanosinicus]
MEDQRHQDGASVQLGSEQAAVPDATMVGWTAPEMTVFACAACGAALTGPLKRLSAVPEAPDYAWWEAEEMGPSPATVPSGCYAIETEPYGPPLVVAEAPGPVMPRHGTHYNLDGQPLVSQGPRGNIVMNPDDCRGLTTRHASAACCGATPDGGLNQVCACGTLVATLCSDCCLPYELHLSPDHVRALSFPSPGSNLTE